MTSNRNNRRFYVVQFTELPFEGIDYYVCVPYSWLICVNSLTQKAVVAYPNNEDPVDTRDRVKRNERPNDEWRFYAAFIKHKSDRYSDAEYWIETGNDNGRSIEEAFKRRDTPEPVLNSIPCSTSQPFWRTPDSDTPQLTGKNQNPCRPLPRILNRPLLPKRKILRIKLKGNAKSGITDHAIIASGCSQQEPSVILTGNELIQNDQMKTSSTSNGETNSEQTQTVVMMENQSVDMSVPYSST